MCLWNWLLWTVSLFKLSRLNLKLVATHPDHHRGMGFLGLSPMAFAPIAFAISAAIGSNWRAPDSLRRRRSDLIQDPGSRPPRRDSHDGARAPWSSLCPGSASCGDPESCSRARSGKSTAPDSTPSGSWGAPGTKTASWPLPKPAHSPILAPVARTSRRCLNRLAIANGFGRWRT